MLKKIIKYFEFIRVFTAVFLAYGIALLIITLISEDPMNVITQFVIGPFQNIRRIGNVIEFMIPVIFTGLGMCMMMQASQFNLIGEGIVFLSAATTAMICTMILPNMPYVVSPIVLIAFSAVLGALLGAIPAILKIKYSANEVVVSLMLNYILVLLGKYLLIYKMSDPSVTYNGSYLIPKQAKLPVLIKGTQVHLGIFISIAAIILIYWFLYKTTKGYEIRMTGKNINFAKYAGINVVGALILAQMIGGALAGIGGTVELLGKYDRFKWMITTGYGFDGMLVAVISKGNPALVVFGAFFLSYIRIGSDIVGRSTDIPLEFVSIIQALVIMLVGAELFMSKFKHRLIVKKSSDADAEASDKHESEVA